MGWTCVVPVKAGPERKSRLAPALDAHQRLALSDRLYHHVVECIRVSMLVEDLVVVSPALAEVDAGVRLWRQRDPSLNAELDHVRHVARGPLMVVNADLPLLERADLDALARAAEVSGCAIAPDRHGTGTNAVALLPGVSFAFAFGPGSLARHVAAAGANARLVQRPGLAFDVDTLADIEAVVALGRPLSEDMARLLRGAADKGAHAALAVGDGCACPP